MNGDSGRGIDVSVVIPAYRATGFIDRAIGSALSQIDVSVEVIVVDDACPLGTGEAVMRRYADDDRVRVIRLDRNGGPSIARNEGFRAARGEWVAILDADDAFYPARLHRLTAQARSLGADVIADNVSYYTAATDTLGPPRLTGITRPVQIITQSLVEGARPGTDQMDLGLLKPMFRTLYLQSLRNLYPTDIRHGEDFHFYFDILTGGGLFFVVPEPGYQWTLRNSGNSQTAIDYRKQAADTRALKLRPAVAGDASLIAALEDRARALQRLDDHTAYLNAMGRRRYAAALYFCIKHPHLVSSVLHSARRRLRLTQRRAHPS